MVKSTVLSEDLGSLQVPMILVPEDSAPSCGL